MKKSARSAFAPIVVLIVSLLSVVVATYPGGPDPGVTGGFGEPTCNQSGCHVSYPVNAGVAAMLGDILIEGFPKQYEAGRTYPIKLTVSHTQDRQNWGFQLATRANGTGLQAGRLKPTSSETQIVDLNGIQYIEHTLDGIPTNTFEFEWVAPAKPAGEVVVNAAGNAANGDLVPEGDYIYSTSVTVASAGK